MHNTESRSVTAPVNILFRRLCAYTFQPGNVTGWGSERVKSLHCTPLLQRPKQTSKLNRHRKKINKNTQCRVNIPQPWLTTNLSPQKN